MQISKPAPSSAPKTLALAGLIFLAAFSLYWGSAVRMQRASTPEMAYFNYLADAFLHGRLYLQNMPATYDLTFSAGQWYVPFPPLPALLLLPGVVLSGPEGVNTVLFGALMAAASVVLAFLLLQALAKRGWTPLRLSDNLWLTLLFGFGTVQWYTATLGTVWAVSQICTVTFMLLAAWLAAAFGTPLWAGAALGLAVMARPNVALCFPLLAALAAQHLRAAAPPVPFPWMRWFRWLAAAALPVVLAVGLLLGYNQLRFGSPLDFGYAQEYVSQPLESDLRTYGQFNLHYVPRNLQVMWLALPEWDEPTRQLTPNPQGMSLLVTTPAILYLLAARRRTWWVLGAWAAFGLLLIPLAAYYNTGWTQFGYRFSLDFMTPVLLLIAAGAGARVSLRLRLLILLGVAVNAWGVVWYLSPLFFSRL